MLARASLLVVALLALPSDAHAYCLALSASVMNARSVDVVFSGTVVGLNQVNDVVVRVTFEVDRVWKGTVPKRFDIYFSPLRAEMPTFEFARRYVVFGEQMPPRARESVGLLAPDGRAFEPIPCGAFLYPSSESSNTDNARVLQQLGNGQPPN